MGCFFVKFECNSIPGLNSSKRSGFGISSASVLMITKLSFWTSSLMILVMEFRFELSLIQSKLFPVLFSHLEGCFVNVPSDFLFKWFEKISMDVFEQALLFQLPSRWDPWKWPPSRPISTQNSQPSWRSFSATSSVSWSNRWEEETWCRSEPHPPSPIAPSRRIRAWISSCRFCSLVSYDFISIS